MTSAASADPTEVMARHLCILRKYAARVLTDGEPLDPYEHFDKTLRLKEFLEIASNYRCTERDVVSLLYRGILK